MQLTGRISTVVAATVAAAFVAPHVAEAQVKVRDHRKKRPAPVVKATGFQPQDGPVGTRVTIRGAGFTPRTQVIFGRTRVRPVRVTPTSITVKVPSDYGDGAIVLRHPGIGNDIAVGRFSVALPLAVQGFAPASGIAGTRVVLRGSGFRPGVRVAMGKVDVRVVRVTPTRLTVVIPEAATTAPFEVTAGKNRARTPRPFRVLSRAPTLTSFTPATGAPGAAVLVKGANIGPAATLHYGPLPMQIRKRGPGWVEGVIPATAKRSRYLRVRTAGGEARSTARFRLEPVPSVDRFKPAYGIAGQRVEIYGRNFRAGDVFSVDGRRMRVLQLRASRVSAVVPRGARSGPIVVARRDYQAASRATFEVLVPPRILRMKPEFGEPGTRVTIVGRDLPAGSKVSYGKRPLRVLKHSVGKAGNDRLVVRIPADADDRRFRVRTRGGETASDKKFRVHYYPVVAGLKPTRGMPGTQITIRGTNLRHVDRVLLGSTDLRVLENRRGRLLVSIPAGARTGTVTLVSYGQRFDTRRKVQVFAVPIIDDVQPRAGVPGTEVVITGRNLRKTTRVYLGDRELPILRLTPGREITAMIPKKARSGQLFVGEGTARVAAPHPFVVLDPPRLDGFAPRKARARQQITLRGRDFTRTTEVVWDGQVLPVVARKGARIIVVSIPDYLEPGKAPLILRQDGVGVAVSKRPLAILPAPPPPRDKKPGPVKVRDHRKK